MGTVEVLIEHSKKLDHLLQRIEAIEEYIEEQKDKQDEKETTKEEEKEEYDN